MYVFCRRKMARGLRASSATLALLDLRITSVLGAETMDFLEHIGSGGMKCMCFVNVKWLGGSAHPRRR